MLQNPFLTDSRGVINNVGNRSTLAHDRSNLGVDIGKVDIGVDVLNVAGVLPAASMVDLILENAMHNWLLLN